MPVEKRFLAKSVFTGHEWLSNHEVILIDNKLVHLEPAQSGYPEIDLLIPSFIDLQVYGAAAQLFSVYPTRDTLDIMYQEFSKSGTHYFLPTVATNEISVVNSGIRAVNEYWKGGGKGCLGLHLEGPWINPDKRGAHDLQFIHSPNLAEVKGLLSKSEGVIKMITLAPEVCDKAILEYLQDAKILVSAGHTMATYEQGIAAFSNGVSLVTHLFNAMSPMQHRAPGLVGAALLHDRVMASIIPDGYHVDWSVIKLSFQLMGNRLFAITDAVTASVEGPYRHTLENDHYVANGVLSGSALTMLSAFNNLILKAGFTIQDAVALCVSNPARAIKVNTMLGTFEKGTDMPCVPLQLRDQRYEIMS